MTLSETKNKLIEGRPRQSFFAGLTPRTEKTFDAQQKPPGQLYLRITEECNYRCKPCQIWQHKDPQDALTTEEKLDLVRQFHFLNGKGVVWMTGGEPLQKMHEFLKVSSVCRKLGLCAGSNINGSYITNEAVAEDIIKYGPNLLLVSLDSHIKGIHDYVRGVEGSYDQVLQAVNLLLRIRNAHFNKFANRIGLTCILFEETLPLFKEYVEFCRQLKVDFVSFQVLTHTFANQNTEKDVFYDKHYFKDNERAIDLLDDIYTQYKSDRFVSLADLDVIRKNLASPNAETKYPVCKSHERNMIIMINGDVQLCFNSHQTRIMDFGKSKRGPGRDG
jgi:MoaA/NifB/PqqE/SkfB family radical SAM enzyme